MPGAQYDPVRLNALIATVREGRRLFGPEAARNLWVDLGLPLRITDMAPKYRDELLIEPMLAWLAEHPAPTLAEITGGMGLDPEHREAIERVRRALKAAGWWNKRARRGGELVWAWFPPETPDGEG